MMARSLLRTALGAGLAVNAVPHGVAGVQGRRFPTPFANPPGRALSPPALNVVWSAINVAGACVLLRGRERSGATCVAGAVGAVSTGLFLASYFDSLEALDSAGPEEHDDA